MIPHIPVFGLTRRTRSVSLLAQLDEREPQILGHPAVTVLLRLPDTLLVDGPSLVFAPETGEYVSQARISVALVLMSVLLDNTCPSVHPRGGQITFGVGEDIEADELIGPASLRGAELFETFGDYTCV
jgi:hypothetical protein